ncbi:Glutamate--cysteine ligase, chloroplastic [Capsicum annuum]|uniref:Glutamate--cysteine ligase, chloroplastic n=1 Tax=Capsicum annuum TaxID=4072 RepID=A0A2G3ADW3_CAPAN|nr:Glutamate--cysteine ligase, chloroplastic [Capsicum annuum]KAF3668848.1 Glutamate--cysteine ligase, chloroplastic [Capsicum annuum]PHT92417.1 Glutamate--cysteine ligase, chloroplastic [Capsicum annuum]
MSRGGVQRPNEEVRKAQNMALMSQAGSSHCIYSEKLRCIGGHSNIMNNMEMFKMKDICFGLDISSLNSSRRVQGNYLNRIGVERRRGGLAIVAASPPTEDAVVAAEPLTKEDLVGYLASGCKSKEKWSRIGTEHEKFGFEFGTLRPMKYEQIADLLNGIAERFDWEKVMEGDKIIGLKQGKQSISLEPGGQFELSGAPLETLHQTCAEVNSHLYQVKAVAEEMGIGFLGTGFQPKWGLKDIPVMPKGRYEIMRNYMPKVGTLGLDMMFRTCTVQVNLDFSSEADMIRKFRAGLALQPIATALFANSPFTDGKPNGYLSMRRHVHIWTDTDNNRAGMLPFVFGDSFGFEQYVEYALDVPMYFVYRKKKYVDCAGMSFRDFMNGKLPPLPGDYPTLNDWENHLTTIFPEVRLKRYLEMRGADGGPWRRLCALPAFWVGILYDEASLQSVLDMTSDWTAEEREMLRNKVPKSGLKTPFRDGLLKHVAQDVVKLAKEGLERRGFKETGFLNEVTEVVKTDTTQCQNDINTLFKLLELFRIPSELFFILVGVTPAEKLLELYHGKWGQNVDPIYEELLY